MATVSVNIANVTSGSSSASATTGATVTASVGDVLAVFCAADNNGTSGVSSTTTCADSDGVNVYTKRAEILQDPGAAAAGVTLTIWTSKITQALSSDTVTVNFSPNTTTKTVTVWRVFPGAGEVVDFWSADTVGSAGSTTNHTAPTVNVPSGFIVFGVAGIETNTAITGDADSTNGSWNNTTANIANTGADLGSQNMLIQHKTVSAAGNQDWECTTAAAKDSARTTLILSVDTLRGGFLLDSSRIESALMIPVGLAR